MNNINHLKPTDYFTYHQI